MKIGLDFNDVVKDTPPLVRAFVIENYGLEVAVSTCSKRDMLGVGLSLEQYRHIKKSIYDTPLALETLPKQGCIESLQRLVVNHEITIVTGMLPTGYEFGRKWLDTFGLCAIELVCLQDGMKKAVPLAGCNVYVDNEISRLDEVRGTVPHLFHFGADANSFAPTDYTTVPDWPSLEAGIALL